MSNIDDHAYPPPTKEFIRNSLTYGLLPDEQGPIEENSDLVDLTQNRGRLMSRFIEFAMENKERIVRIPMVGSLALSIKRSMMKKSVSMQRAYRSELDFTDILGLGNDDFIRQLYLRALDRLPDPQAIEGWKSALNNGAKKEAIVYMVCTSQEFAARRRVAHLSEYHKVYRMYRSRARIKRTPVLGWLWSFAAIPRRLMDLFHQLSALQAHIDKLSMDLFHQLSALQAHTDKLSMDLFHQLSALQAHTDKLSSEHARSLQNLSTEIKLVSSQQSALQAQLDIANQNIVNAHIKLDQTGTAILNMLYQNKPFIYSLSGGVTAVQTKEYIIGVPSEQWRLAVFLNLYGSLEIGTEKYFRSILKKGMNVLDVGAYIGIYTLHALAAGCNVYSYEPTPRLFEILLDNIGINGFEPTRRANAYNLAVSNVEDKVEFSLDGNGHGQNNSFYAIDGDKRIEVNTTYLDKHLNYVDRIDVAKIDVEGAEPLVLMGMRNIIAKSPEIKIIMEFAPSHIKRAGKDPLDFIQQIRSMGLDIRLIDGGTGEILGISDEELCNVFSANILLEKPS